MHFAKLLPAALLAVAATGAQAVPLVTVVNPYLSFAGDSPWAGFAAVTLEDWEGAPKAGYSVSGGGVLGPGRLTDSVDGANPGQGSTGHSYYSFGPTDTMTFSFVANGSGLFPQLVGIVWTDVGYLKGESGNTFTGVSNVTVEFFDSTGTSLGITNVTKRGDGKVAG
ncbi:MAG: hypothetical protein MUF30_11370, partial [Burkholderiales bacterium]|nr:hypothetical protein [Burkholderiales bacterium]